MIRSLWNFMLRFFFRTNWRFPEFVIRPARLLYEAGLVMSTAFVGRQGVGKTFALAQELLQQIKANPDQPFFIFDWSGGLINTLFQLIISDPQREEIERRLVFDAMGDSKLDRDIALALADVLDVFKTRRIRARVGYPFPGWTPKEVIRNGLVVACDGSGLTNNHRQKDYAYLELFHLVLDEINKRVPSAPGYHPINWVMDEVYTFTETPSVSRMLAHLPSEYRSRKLQLFLVVQSLKQLAGEENGKKGLEDVFFSFGNMVVFSLLDIEDCFTVIKNLIPFDPQQVKVPARSDGQHDIMESRDEQVAVRAYQLQHLAQRECYVRRFVNEARMDRVIHIGRTRDVNLTATYQDVEDLKDKLMLARGVLLSEAEKMIGARKISGKKNLSRPTSV